MELTAYSVKLRKKVQSLKVADNRRLERFVGADSFDRP